MARKLKATLERENEGLRAKVRKLENEIKESKRNGNAWKLDESRKLVTELEAKAAEDDKEIGKTLLDLKHATSEIKQLKEDLSRSDDVRRDAVEVATRAEKSLAVALEAMKEKDKRIDRLLEASKMNERTYNDAMQKLHTYMALAKAACAVVVNE